MTDVRPRDPWRRFLRFSVRGLVLLVLVIGAGIGWLVRSAHIQRDAVAAIEKLGGETHYDWDWNNGKGIPDGAPRAPGWLVRLIGVDYFGHVASVVLPDPTDAAIAQIGRLSRLEKLHLSLDNTQVSDDALAHLSGLPNLSVLSLSGTHITDSGLAHLHNLTNLSTLDLRKTGITDAGLAHLTGLTRLSELDLGYTRVTDAGLAQLKDFRNVSALGLLSTKITDAGLAHLKGLPRLSKLDLSYTWISDAGLTHLKGLTKLSSLRLYATHVTDAGVKDLKQAVPGLKITRR